MPCQTSLSTLVPSLSLTHHLSLATPVTLCSVKTESTPRASFSSEPPTPLTPHHPTRHAFVSGLLSPPLRVVLVCPLCGTICKEHGWRGPGLQRKIQLFSFVRKLFERLSGPLLFPTGTFCSCWEAAVDPIQTGVGVPVLLFWKDFLELESLGNQEEKPDPRGQFGRIGE